jgi:hypothetical protein
MTDPTTPCSTFFHQSWPIAEGTLLVQLRTNRVLLGDEFVELGKVMAEVERLAEMLAWVAPEAPQADFDPEPAP